MSKIQFNPVLYNEMYQLLKVSSGQNVKLAAESLRDHFQIPDRVARYYYFMIDNAQRVEKESFLNHGENRLVIPDIHAPFTRPGFLEHCIKTYHDYKCTKVTFLGDILDNHYSSNYNADPDGYGAKDEVEMAIEMLQPWYNAFPEAEVCTGNHDARIDRQAFDAGIASIWIKSYNDVLGTPEWVWDDQFDHFDVRYVHGDGPGGGINGSFNRALNWRMSVVQAHWHTSSMTRWSVSEKDRLFSFQLGCGINEKAYAFAYGKKSLRKMVIECGVVLDDGRIPIHCPMYL